MTAEQLASIHAACFTSPRPWTMQEFNDLLANSANFIVTTPSGFALGRIADPEVELLTIAVSPDARHKGAGFALMTMFLESAKKRGAEEAFLEVAENNLAARALYEKCGFASAGLRKDYYQGKSGDKISALVLKRAL
ncbi:MAG: ribosomal protein S18-alanine N-acetyltransferase [Rhodobacteraceae bacterium]|nr:ribosomal protein S18-alanine N-acetyltransferase [Paracoccaceae bacterium]